ncbi:hypothetical protein VNO77_03936 [Canavalia gladiata]|uniref:Uncharacterized protein n=1 Tax=Canavalia gladiata TaxID=3824 RepID=A0AAN9R7A8_CANGL
MAVNEYGNPKVSNFVNSNGTLAVEIEHVEAERNLKLTAIALCLGMHISIYLSPSGGPPESIYLYGDQKQFVEIDQNDLFPYLLVNIGCGVGMIKLLELSYLGNNRTVDMLVGDIYGGMDYSKEREDYKPVDIVRSLLRMISNNIGQISYLNALRFGPKRIFLVDFSFGGILSQWILYLSLLISGKWEEVPPSLALGDWLWSMSKGEAKAMFLRHEGFLGAVGAFMSSDKHGVKELLVNQKWCKELLASYPLRRIKCMANKTGSLMEMKV